MKSYSGEVGFPSKGIGPFDDMSSPLNAQVPSKDPRAAVAKNKAFDVKKPSDPLGYVEGEV